MKKTHSQSMFASSRGRVAGLRTLSAPLRVVVATMRGLRATVRTRRAMVPQVSAPFPTPSARFHPTLVTVAHTHRWLTNIDGRPVYLRRRPYFLPYRPYLVVLQSFVPGGTRPTGEVWWTNGIGSRIHNHVRASSGLQRSTGSPDDDSRTLLRVCILCTRAPADDGRQEQRHRDPKARRHEDRPERSRNRASR
jgi:hypothetical protein